MTGTLTALLLRLSEGSARLLWGRAARPHFGPRFDRLLAEGVLVERPPAEVWSTCLGCECGFDVRPVQRIGGRIIAACPFDVAADTQLEEDDLRDFRIDPERLIALIAEASGFDEAVEGLARDLWRVGWLGSGRSIVVGITAQVLDQPGIVLLLKAAAGGGPITVLAPEPCPAIRLRFVEAGIDFVELRSALQPSAGKVDRLDRGSLEPKGTGSCLKIERRARRATLNGRTINLSEQLFGLLHFLAERALDSPATVETRAIEDQVWGDGIHRIASSVRDPIRALREALVAGAADEAAARGLIEYRRNPNGYRLRIDPCDISISD
jgi:DNA-binding winged helix-turn-helix (wHTH) protein